MDIATFTPFITAAAEIAAPVLFAYGLKLLRDHNISTTLYEAVGRAGGLAAQDFLASGAVVTNTAQLAKSAKVGEAYLVSTVAGAIASKGADPAALASAELATHLPTIAAAVAPVVPVVAPIVEGALSGGAPGAAAAAAAVIAPVVAAAVAPAVNKVVEGALSDLTGKLA